MFSMGAACVPHRPLFIEFAFSAEVLEHSSIGATVYVQLSRSDEGVRHKMERLHGSTIRSPHTLAWGR